MCEGHRADNNTPNVGAKRTVRFFFLLLCDFDVAEGHGMRTVNWGS